MNSRPVNPYNDRDLAENRKSARYPTPEVGSESSSGSDRAPIYNDAAPVAGVESESSSGHNNAPADARLLFRYLGGDEWQEYRAILKVFAGTFFAEFTPDEVASAVTEAGVDPDVVADRLESLRRWGNLTVSSSVGNPSSLDDYYRKRHRYLITRSGQEVFGLVEGVLDSIEEHIDVQAGRLRDLHRALLNLNDHSTAGFDEIAAVDLTDTVRTVFDLHERFTTELTQFFAQLNLWQSRYDLDADEVQFFANVLVTYVSEQLTEIERMTRPIARCLQEILPRIPLLLPALQSGLAVRVDDAGLAQNVAVRRLAGTGADDWKHLKEWFVARPPQASRLDQLTQQAVAAVRTLTTNITRLSRIGLGAASRRADFLRLAGFFDQATDDQEAHAIASAVFGLGSCRRLGILSDDADDPVPTITPWKDAPRAVVPVSLRERGSTAQRGNASPIRDRRRQRDLIRRRREQERVNREVIAEELLSSVGDDGTLNGAELSDASFRMLLDLIGRAEHTSSNVEVHASSSVPSVSLPAGGVTTAVNGRNTGTMSAALTMPSTQPASIPAVRTSTAIGVRCDVRRIDNACTVVSCPAGRLAMHGLVVTVSAAES